MAPALSKGPYPDPDRIVGRIVPLIKPLAATYLAYAAWKLQWKKVLVQYFTGPGRISRILMLLFVLSNLKTMPFVWTYRVWNAILFHCFNRKSPQLGPRALFRPMISESYVPLMEIDYNIHKSNSTYFSDLDVSRSHLATYLLRPGFRRLDNNTLTKLVIDDVTGKAIPGKMGIMLGAVHCSFRREIKPYAKYEMWSRILAWDRKWLYMVTHFVPKGMAKPKEWLDPKFAFGRVKTRKASASTADWESKIYATGVSKYVFKLGRLTIHPTIPIEASGLLPERPGGWRGGENGVGDEADLGDVVDGVEWNWKMVEKRRREGMVYAQSFGNLDELQSWFNGGDGGDGSALGKFGMG